MGEVVFDIETKESFAEVGSSKVTDLSISVVGLYIYDEDRFMTFRESQLKEFWQIIERCSCLIGYNSVHFDVPILEKYYGSSLKHIQQLDLLQRIRDSLGHRLKLDDVAKATLNVQKSGHGLQAVEWYKQGEIEKIEKYCLDDVRITRDIYEFGKKNKQLFYPDFEGIKPFPVDFSYNELEKNMDEKQEQRQMSLL